ncbi:hypothetical protein Sjap_022224 [Stephania japonica]|uniref:Metallophosphoesterase 1 n=1 Tax=Stephania japonica TaxID=461633 RepID=A0AAP0ERN5_9MAGN
MVNWKSIVPLLFLAALVIFEERVSVPSCVIVPRDDDVEESGVQSEELKVMMVSNLLLMGSEARYMNVYFRDSYTTKFFRKSFERLKPDMLVVLGDISARGSELTSGKWLSVLQQFQRILGPFLGLPLHVILGDRDVGECSKLNARSIEWLTRNLPGLDSSGSGAFEMSNISFVSLNAVAMLCGNNDLRFSIEKVIESESLDLRAYTKEKEGKVVHDTISDNNFLDFKWRENLMQSGSGPVLLLHFPLHRTRSSKCWEKDIPKGSLFPSPHGHPKIQDHRLNSMGSKVATQVDARVDSLKEQMRVTPEVLQWILTLEGSIRELTVEVQDLRQQIKSMCLQQSLPTSKASQIGEGCGQTHSIQSDSLDLVASKESQFFVDLDQIEAPSVQLPDLLDPELCKVLPTSMASVAFFLYASMKQIWVANGNKNLDLPDLAVFREDFIEVVTETSTHIDSLFLSNNDRLVALALPPWPLPRAIPVHLEKTTSAVGCGTCGGRMMRGMRLHCYVLHYCHVHTYTMSPNVYCIWSFDSLRLAYFLFHSKLLNQSCMLFKNHLMTLVLSLSYVDYSLLYCDVVDICLIDLWSIDRVSSACCFDRFMLSFPLFMTPTTSVANGGELSYYLHDFCDMGPLHYIDLGSTVVIHFQFAHQLHLLLVGTSVQRVTRSCLVVSTCHMSMLGRVPNGWDVLPSGWPLYFSTWTLLEVHYCPLFVFIDMLFWDSCWIAHAPIQRWHVGYPFNWDADLLTTLGRRPLSHLPLRGLYGYWLGSFILGACTLLSSYGPLIRAYSSFSVDSILVRHLEDKVDFKGGSIVTILGRPSFINVYHRKTKGHAGPGPYELFQTLPPNATEYIFQGLKPRIVFSAHSHEFCDHIHRDGIREVTVPAMTWDARDDPGFIVASFGRNRAVTVSQCSLARESRVLMAYGSVLILLISTALIASRHLLMNPVR